MNGAKVVALATVGLPVIATAVTGGISEEHVNVIGIIAGAVVGLGALGTGVRYWIVQPEIDRKSAALREEIGKLRTDVIAMLHRIENSMVGQSQDMKHVQKSLDELWDEHRRTTGHREPRADDSGAIRIRATDREGFDPSEMRTGRGERH